MTKNYTSPLYSFLRKNWYFFRCYLYISTVFSSLHNNNLWYTHKVLYAWSY